mgnify:CR=1 FL=1
MKDNIELEGLFLDKIEKIIKYHFLDDPSNLIKIWEGTSLIVLNAQTNTPRIGSRIFMLYQLFEKQHEKQ